MLRGGTVAPVMRGLLPTKRVFPTPLPLFVSWGTERALTGTFPHVLLLRTVRRARERRAEAALQNNRATAFTGHVYACVLVWRCGLVL